MCVILSGKADKVLVHLPDAMRANPHGNGVAWVDEVDGKRVIKYIKGMTDEKAIDLVRSFGSESDIVFHARISTAGGVSEELCHPFPIERVPELKTQGTTDMVLFHNGHVSGWEAFVPDFLVKAQPTRWSDSRAIAHAIAMGFINVKDLGGKIPGVYAVLSTEHFPDFPKHFGTIRRFGHWTMVKGGVWASNTHFLNSYSTGGYSSYFERYTRKRYARNFYRWEKQYKGTDYTFDKEVSRADFNNDEEYQLYADLFDEAEDNNFLEATEMESEALSDKAAKSAILFDNPSTWKKPLPFPDNDYTEVEDWEKTSD